MGINTPTNNKWLLSCLLTAVFMAILDVAVANIALPMIQRTLGASGAELQLVTAGYIAAYAVLLIPSARLGVRLGYRPVFLAGLGLFTAASLMAGLAWSSSALIAFRLLQGVGAALLMPQVLSLIQHGFQDKKRARALSMYAAVIAGAAIVGQIAGGLLVSANIGGLSWRPVFLINAPIGLVLLALSWRFLPRVARPQIKPSLDAFGALLLALAILGLVVPATFGFGLGWPAWAWWFSIGSLAAIAGFVRHERSLARRGGQPLVHARLLHSPSFSPAALTIFVAMGGYGGILFLLTMYIQSGLGLSALTTGLAFLPSAVAFGLASLNWRRLPQAWHIRLAPVGLGITTLAFTGLAWGISAGSITLGTELAILAFGAGMGLAFSPLFAQGLTHVQPQDAADASGILTTANQLGQVLGIALYGSLLLGIHQTTGSYQRAAVIVALAMAVGSGLAAAISLQLRRESDEA